MILIWISGVIDARQDDLDGGAEIGTGTGQGDGTAVRFNDGTALIKADAGAEFFGGEAVGEELGDGFRGGSGGVIGEGNADVAAGIADGNDDLAVGVVVKEVERFATVLDEVDKDLNHAGPIEFRLGVVSGEIVMDGDVALLEGGELHGNGIGDDLGQRGFDHGKAAGIGVHAL